MKNKLIAVERTIEVCNINGELINEIIINVPIEELKQIVPPSDNDADLYDGYLLTNYQLQQLNNLLQHKIDIEFGSHTYLLVANGIYNW